MFELNDEIKAAIIFAMENQKARYGVDKGSGLLYPMDDPDNAVLETGRDLVDLPSWASEDGFKLMESFARGVANPEAHAALSAALNRGRGVFRAYKDALALFPDVEKRWHAHKDAAMKRRVDEWYRDVAALDGLERLGPEPEDTDDLVDEVFGFREAGPEDADLLGVFMDKARASALDAFPETLVSLEFESLERALYGNDTVVYLAEASGGAPVGIAVAMIVRAADSALARLALVFVDEGHRRLGIGRRLVDMVGRLVGREGIRRYLVDLPFAPEWFGASLSSVGYQRFGVRAMATPD